MPNTPMTIKVPGKLMIAGEFAVLEPHHQLVVMAVDRYVYTTIEESNQNYVSLHDFQLIDLNWDYENGKLTIHTDHPKTVFVQEAMRIAMVYLHEKNIQPGPFAISVKSELDDASGKKYGLGSSAAVVTSIISAILTKYFPTYTKELLFKLAALAHVNVQGNGSGADIAASAYGGFLQYASFQAGWLKAASKEAKSLSGLVEGEWEYLSLQPLRIPNNVYVCVGWTGKPASTAKLVDELMKLKDTDPAAYQTFLDASEKAVYTFLKGVNESNTDLLFEGVKRNRAALARVGNQANVAIETPLLRTLCDLAEEYGGAGKSSGAGGGDCGIAFMPSKEQADELMEAWEKAGITPLTIKPSSIGASISEL
ncbi:phosphomevalonate kinase [Oceanobacillus kapialis]|uniref:phosphomevalonate kinase n=1 Tax=Oceanobacillus kapialis TaxID=481353 RepID=UPI00384AABCD